MMLIRTHVAPSPIHGVGLFTLEPIPANHSLWHYDDAIDIRMSGMRIREIARRCPVFPEFIERYSYEDEDYGRVISLDDSRFMNHSKDPNTRFDRWHGWATRPILEGEELTCDYRECGMDMEGIK